MDLHFQFFFKPLFFVICFYPKIFSSNATAFDILLTSFYMPDNLTTEDAQYNFLHPHDFDCLTIIVPNTRKNTSIVLRVLRNGEALAILLAFTVFLLTNILIKWPRDRSVSSHCLHTFGMCLAQSKLRVRNRCEMLWTVGLLVFSVTAIATLSAVIYQKLITDQSLEPIRTMKDLAESDITIYIADLYFEIGSWNEMIEFV